MSFLLQGLSLPCKKLVPRLQKTHILVVQVLGMVVMCMILLIIRFKIRVRRPASYTIFAWRVEEGRGGKE